ncbi:MAG: tRNA (guanosine(46)-N7)-methyltransferase TrmB, partial [Saprospiraceae bacterium]
MSRRNKLQKFAEVLSFPNVYENFDAKAPGLAGENGERVEMKGHWRSRHFGNDHPLTLELACGKGDYALGLAQRFPERNFIGVDIKGARIWRGAKT